MYSRSFGDPAPGPENRFGPTVSSDGQLYNMQNQPPPPPPPPPEPENAPPRDGGGLLGSFRNSLSRLGADDLILAAIGLLILLDGESDNDVIALFIIALLFL